MDGPDTLRRTECKMKETFNQTSFRLGGFDLTPSCHLQERLQVGPSSYQTQKAPVP